MRASTSINTMNLINRDGCCSVFNNPVVRRVAGTGNRDFFANLIILPILAKTLFSDNKVDSVKEELVYENKRSVDYFTDRLL